MLTSHTSLVQAEKKEGEEKPKKKAAAKPKVSWVPAMVQGRLLGPCVCVCVVSCCRLLGGWLAHDG